MMNFQLVEWKNDDEFFNIQLEKIENVFEFFISIEEKLRGVAEQQYKREAM